MPKVEGMAGWVKCWLWHCEERSSDPQNKSTKLQSLGSHWQNGVKAETSICLEICGPVVPLCYSQQQIIRDPVSHKVEGPKLTFWNRRDGSVVKGTYCSCTRLSLVSKTTCHSCHKRSNTLLWFLRATVMCVVYFTCIQGNFCTHKMKINFRKAMIF